MHICCSCYFFRFVLRQKSPNYRVYTKPRELTNQVSKETGAPPRVDYESDFTWKNGSWQPRINVNCAVNPWESINFSCRLSLFWGNPLGNPGLTVDIWEEAMKHSYISCVHFFFVVWVSNQLNNPRHGDCLLGFTQNMLFLTFFFGSRQRPSLCLPFVPQRDSYNGSFLLVIGAGLLLLFLRSSNLT